MTGDRIKSVDSVWLNVDRPNNLMVIEALVLLDRPIATRRLTVLLQDRLVRPYPIFRQRVTRPRFPFDAARWDDDPDFALSRHIRRVRLASPGDDSSLRRYVEHQMCKPLPGGRPLWEAHLIDGYGDGAALYCRLHHALADGVTLARLLLSLTDGLEDPPAGEERITATVAALPAAAASETVGGSLGGAIRRTASGAAGFVREVSRRADPRLAGRAAVLAAQGVQVLNKLVFSHNPRNALDQNPGIAKLAAWSQPFPLATVKAAGRQAGATVNDVLMSALAGAVSTYFTEQSRPVADLSTMVPVNLRQTDGPLLADLGNRFALVFLRLPMGIMGWRERLVETKRRMDGIKRSPESAITFALINVIGGLHPTVERWLVDFFAGKAVGVTTNVVGPTVPRYLAGARVNGVLAWVPGSGRQNLGVCIVTYDQTVRIGFKVDAGAIPDPDRLVDAFNRQLDRLLSQTTASP